MSEIIKSKDLYMRFWKNNEAFTLAGVPMGPGNPEGTSQFHCLSKKALDRRLGSAFFENSILSKDSINRIRKVLMVPEFMISPLTINEEIAFGVDCNLTILLNDQEYEVDGKVFTLYSLSVRIGWSSCGHDVTSAHAALTLYQKMLEVASRLEMSFRGYRLVRAFDSLIDNTEEKA